MEPLIAVLLMFGLGMAAEAYRILIWRRMKKTDYLALTGFLALAAVYSPLLAEGKLTGSYIYDGFVIFYFVFPAFYLMYFKKMILPAIDERVLLVWNILFIYATASFFGKLGLWAVAVATIFIGAIIILLVKNMQLSPKIKSIFYLWYLFIVLTLGIMQLGFGDLLTANNPVTAFLGGMASLYLFVCVIQIVRMILPFPSKRQTPEERMAEWRDDARLMADKFCGQQVPPRQMLAVAVLAAALIAANSYFGLMRLSTLIAVVMVATAYAVEAYGEKAAA